MSSILVIGGNGQLGSEIKSLSMDYSGYYFQFIDIEDVDITDESQLKDFIGSRNFDVIINCAAYTAVDKAESEYKLANKVNHLAVGYLAKIAKENEIKLIHVSTDYVFDGTNYSPYVETDKVNPQSVYGLTKLKGEEIMSKINPSNSIIIRTSWVYSSFGNNFVKTMLRLGQEKERLNVVYDQIGTPTYAKDLAGCILDIVPDITNENVEFYHFSNEGVTSWYDFAQEIMKLSNLSCEILPIETTDYPTPANRPHYSVLNKKKIKETFGVKIPYWKDGLIRCLNEMN